jgi:hypothetical protein
VRDRNSRTVSPSAPAAFHSVRKAGREDTVDAQIVDRESPSHQRVNPLLLGIRRRRRLLLIGWGLTPSSALESSRSKTCRSAPARFVEAVEAAGPEGLSPGEFLAQELDDEFPWRNLTLPEMTEKIGDFFDRLGLSEADLDILEDLFNRIFHQWVRAGLDNKRLEAENERLKGEIAILRGELSPT